MPSNQVTSLSWKGSRHGGVVSRRPSLLIVKVPIMTRLPPNNVDFILMDMNQRLEYRDQRFHVVHARTIALAVCLPFTFLLELGATHPWIQVESWEALLAEVRRILVPGGVFLSGEFEHPPVLEGGEVYSKDHFPSGHLFFEVIQEILPNRRSEAARIDEHLNAIGGYRDITREQFLVPVGPWPIEDERQEIGQAMHEAFRLYLQSFRVSFLEYGWNGQAYDELVQAANSILLLRTPGSCLVYNVVHAVRV